jgi:hypothetical protein
MSVAISAVYRPQPEADWKPAEILADHPSGGLVLREVGKFYRGVFVVPREQVRLSGSEFVSGATR